MTDAVLLQLAGRCESRLGLGGQPVSSFGICGKATSRKRPVIDASVLGVCVVLAGASPQQSPEPSPDKPPALLAFERARTKINAELSARNYSPRRQTAGRSRFITIGDQVAYFRDASTDGTTGQYEDGKPAYGLEQAALALADAVWSKHQSGTTAQAALGESSPRYRAGVIDFRIDGMVPGAKPIGCSPQDAIAQLVHDRLGAGALYSQSEVEDGLVTVEAKSAQDQHSIVWYLDPALDWNAVQVDERSGDQVFFSTKTEYARRGDVWIPTKIVLVGPDGDVNAVTEFTYTKVNSPDLPKQLTPNDIGVLVGMPVNVEQGGQASQMRWTGKKLVPGPEYVAMEGRGEVHTDPSLVEEWRQAMARAAVTQPSPATSQPKGQPQSFADVEQRIQKGIETLRAPQLDEWDKYVLGVIEKYKLNDEQRQKCLAILKDCKEQRDNHLQKRAAEIERLRMRKLPTAGDAKLAEEQLELLMKPVRKIFDRLKERVMKVPTRKQIEEAK